MGMMKKGLGMLLFLGLLSWFCIRLGLAMAAGVEPFTAEALRLTALGMIRDLKALLDLAEGWLRSIAAGG